MAQLTFAFDAICDANNHVRLTASLDGGPARQFVISVDDLFAAWDADSAQAAALAVLRLHFKGRTKAQIRQEIAGGVSLTV